MNCCLGIDKSLCCDLCNPKLFDNIRPSKPQQATRQKTRKRVAPVLSVRTALYRWRREMKSKHWPRSMWVHRLSLMTTPASYWLPSDQSNLKISCHPSSRQVGHGGINLAMSYSPFSTRSTFQPFLKHPGARNDCLRHLNKIPDR